ncbi:ATP-binding protein [Alteromonas sp. ASW11-36]|uniref:ATP-binding protein n=1 Tax=Alteromonas arenosi TaxID=3055817 RepID=A0ABT7T133_9ALTE|nr:ATP-binding protein [Alteromonas sp. ASW11-36]MDM7862162.1 ATP-binding protein [Alteromonas sp. ASW11-36]
MKQMELMMNTDIKGSVKAIYKKTNIAIYDGNPLIECLPSLGSPQEVIDRFDRFPSDIDRAAAPGQRSSALVAELNNIFVGLPQHYELALWIDQKIKSGYVARNPAHTHSASLLQENYSRQMRGEPVMKDSLASFEHATPSGIIYGVPGTGKTTSLKRALSHYNQVIQHESLGITQLSYLFLDFPHDGSLKILCKNFFDAINRATGKPNTVWEERRESIDSLLRKMQAAVVRFHIGILVIDEFQFWRSKTRNSDEVIAFLVSLINTIKIPVVFSGTPAAYGRLESHAALARRVTGFNTWDPLQSHYSSTNDTNKLWHYFVRKVWNIHFLSKPRAKLTNEIVSTWYDCTQGILDLAVKLFIQTQLHAIRSQKEVITAELIRRTYQDDFKSVHSVIRALRSKNPDLISEFPDLPISPVTANIAKLHSSIEAVAIKSTPTSVEPILEDLVDCLVCCGFSEAEAKPAVERALSENKGLEKRAILPIVTDLLKQQKPKAAKKVGQSPVKKSMQSMPEEDINAQHSLFDKLIN